MTSTHLRSLPILLMAAVLVPVHLQPQARQSFGKITPEDLESVLAPLNPVLAPDGRQFAVVRNGQIALFPTDGGWPVLLTSELSRRLAGRRTLVNSPS